MSLFIGLNSTAWWSTSGLVLIATVIEVRCRRIFDWLIVPFLVAGMFFGVARHGATGLEKSLGGVALPVGALSVFCGLRGIGMGDLKLCAAVGAWIGCAQSGVALAVMAVAGGLISRARRMPYAPAILIGTLFSFLRS